MVLAVEGVALEFQVSGLKKKATVSIRHLGEILRIRVRWKEEIETLRSPLDVFGRNVRL